MSPPPKRGDHHGRPMRAALLTISTSKAGRRGRKTRAGARLAAFAEGLGLEIAGAEILADEQRTVEARLPPLVRRGRGRAGPDQRRHRPLAPDDITPRATRAIVRTARHPGSPRRCRAAFPAPTPSTGCSPRNVAGARGPHPRRQPSPAARAASTSAGRRSPAPSRTAPSPLLSGERPSRPRPPRSGARPAGYRDHALTDARGRPACRLTRSWAQEGPDRRAGRPAAEA